MVDMGDVGLAAGAETALGRLELHLTMAANLRDEHGGVPAELANELGGLRGFLAWQMGAEKVDCCSVMRSCCGLFMHPVSHLMRYGVKSKSGAGPRI